GLPARGPEVVVADLTQAGGCGYQPQRASSVAPEATPRGDPEVPAAHSERSEAAAHPRRGIGARTTLVRARGIERRQRNKDDAGPDQRSPRPCHRPVLGLDHLVQLPKVVGLPAAVAVTVTADRVVLEQVDEVEAPPQE